MVKSAELDRRIQFRRAAVTDDGLQTAAKWSKVNPATDNIGPVIAAKRKDGGAAEGGAAAGIESTVTATFIVRSSAFTRTIRPTDRLVDRGATFDITGVVEMGRDCLLITGTARSDR